MLDNNNYPHITQNSSLNPDKCVCKTHNSNDQVNEITGQMWTFRGTKSEPEDTKDHHHSDSPDSNFDSLADSEWLSQTDEIIEVTLSKMKYVMNFPVTINRNNTISVFDITGATISCMSKACFDTLQPKPKLVWTTTYRANGAHGKTLGPIGMTTGTLKFPKKFHQQFIICKNLLWPVIIRLDFSHNYLIGIDWFSSNQLYLH